MDTPDKTTAKRVMQINKDGIAASTTGYEGPYTVGITVDGQILGSWIAANSIDTNQLSIGLNNWIKGTDDGIASKVEKDGIISAINQSSEEVAMFPLAYPVFYDVGKLMGKMFEFQDEITTNQIREKLFDEYGERGIIDFHTPKLITTMREIGGVVSETRGRQAKAEISVENSEIICFMTEVAMKLAGRSYYTFSELTEFPFMFPFSYRVAKELVLQNERFVTTNFGGELSVSLKD